MTNWSLLHLRIRLKDASECGPGCNCGGTRIGTKGKVIICLVVAIAAAIVLANSVMQKAETGADGGLNAFTAKTCWQPRRDTAENDQCEFFTLG